jgi:hypothetical protein
MIRAEKAHRIMQLYERDYDNFLNKLKTKAKTATTEKDSAAAKQTLQQAKDNKAAHLAQKAKELLDKNGGIAGAQHTVQNVMKYFKDNSPSDYSVSVGNTNNTTTTTTPNPTDKTIMGLPPIAVYAGGTVLFLLAIWGLSTVVKRHQDQVTSAQNNPINLPQ